MAPAILRPSTTTDVCSIEEFVAGKEVFRVAPVGHIPIPYPCRVGCCSQKGADVAQAIQDQYMQILRAYGIRYKSISFRSMWRKCFRYEAADTLMIEMWDADTDNWQTAATEILELFLAAGLQPSEIKVEIASPTRTLYDISKCLPDEEQLLGAIREVEPRVLEVVRKELPDIWTSVAYHMREQRAHWKVTTRKPTVLVMCKLDAQSDFEKIEALIAEAVQSRQFPEIALHLELLPGLIGLEAPGTTYPSPPPRDASKCRFNRGPERTARHRHPRRLARLQPY